MPSAPEPVQSAAATGQGPARGRFRDAVRHRDLRLLITAFLVDQIGSWSYVVVISVYVFDRTHSTQWLAALGICRWGPGLLLASYGGVIADRYERVTILIVSALASAVLMVAMAVVVAADAPVGFVLVLSAASAVVLAPYQSAAGALTPEIVGEKDLATANSIFSGMENLVVVVGPAIGGLLLLTGRPVIGIAINAVSFVIAAGVIARLRVRSRGGADAEGSTVQQWKAGLRALTDQPVAVAIVLFCALDSAVYGASTVLYVPLSVRLGTGPNGYSYLLAGAALGGVLGVGLANRLSGTSRPAARELAPVTAPGYVGELGLLHGIRRTATVRALRESTLLRIDGQEFLSALQATRPSPTLLSVAGVRMARTPGRAPGPGPAREPSRLITPHPALHQEGETDEP